MFNYLLVYCSASCLYTILDTKQALVENCTYKMSLFLPEFHREIQSKFLDSIIPELKEDSINLNNYELIDDLLSFLELSLNQSLVPSEEIFHLLLTIASRSSSCNWSADLSNSKNGFMDTQEHLLASKHYNQLLHKSSLNDRCINILQRYKDLVYNGNKEVYSVLQQAINHLVTREHSRQRTSNITSILKPIDQLSTPKIKEERRNRKRRHDEITEAEGSDDTPIVISDSEDDYNDPDFRLLHESQEGSASADVFKSPSQTNGTLSGSWIGLRLFDEPLLKDQFHLSEGRFGMWELINWTFYCAGLSTSFYPQKNTNCHTIYEAQANTLLFVFDIIEYNLVNTLNDIFEDQDPYVTFCKSSTNKNRFASLQVEDNSSILLLRLLQSLGYLQSQWYDRIVEFVFNGLTRLPPCPKTCYQHESILVRPELNLKKRGTSSRGVSSQAEIGDDNDNMDSMSLRFKICATVYYWSLVFDKSVFSGKSFGRNSSTHLNPAELLKFICEKFNYIDNRYLIEFYYSLLSPSAIPSKYKQLFLTNLGIQLLKMLTGLSENINFELDDFLHLNEGNNQVNNLDLILSWINDPSIYAQITEDESYDNFNKFYQSWTKLNFILEWSLSVTLGDLKDLGNNIYKDPIIYNKFKNADSLRKMAFQGFLNTSLQPKEVSNFKFQLSESSVDDANSNMMTWEPFTSILSNYI